MPRTAGRRQAPCGRAFSVSAPASASSRHTIRHSVSRQKTCRHHTKLSAPSAPPNPCTTRSSAAVSVGRRRAMHKGVGWGRCCSARSGALAVLRAENKRGGRLPSMGVQRGRTPRMSCGPRPALPGGWRMTCCFTVCP
jgi:hypothetical protein